MKDVTGRIIFRPGEVDVEGLEGRYGAGTVLFSGKIWPGDKNKEIGYCLEMKGDGVELSDELSSTLPGPLSALVGELKPKGVVNLRADMSKNAEAGCTEDRLEIECLGNAIDSNLLPYSLSDISGTMILKRTGIELKDVVAQTLHKIGGEEVQSVMKIAGQVGFEEADNGGIEISGGEVRFSGENVKFKGKSLTMVDTVLVYDAESRRWLSRDFVADFYDGKMIGKLELNKSDEGGLSYTLEASVAGADLKKFLLDTPREDVSEEHYSTGSISGSLSIMGSVADDTIRLGRCRLRIIDMQVGKLSPMAKLLQVLNVTESSDYAFDQMIVDAYIQDNEVFFRQLDLSGKSLAFNGSGWMDLDTDDIDLSLTARGKRLATSKPSLWQSLTEGLGRAVVRIDVKGKSRDPKITTKTLPVIRETLGIFGTRREQTRDKQ